MYVHYHFKQINVERVGGRLVRVLCPRCSCEYFYHFTRVGFGSDQAHYGLGVDTATLKATRKAQKDLDRRLASEAELVPCPKCKWIPDELIKGFRRGSYRNLSRAARVVAFIGFAATVMDVTLFTLAAKTFLLYLVPLAAGLWLLSGALIVQRNWLRSRIRPNENHPQPPKLPPASPPPLFKDPVSGDLTPASQEPVPLDAGQSWCDFQIGRHSWPLLCCGCLQPTTLDDGYEMKVTKTLGLTIPRCSDCAHSARQRLRRIWWNGAPVAFVATAAIVMPLNLGWLEFGIATVALLIVSLAIDVLVARRMTAPASIAAKDRDRGVVRLRLQSAEYARIVAERLGP